MPLEKSKSPAAFKRNVRTLMGEVGKSPHVQSRDQALAVAYSIRRRGRAEGGPADDELILPQRNPAMPADWAQRGVMGVANTLGNIVAAPRRAMEHGITSEEAVPWAGETALTMAGASSPFAARGAIGALGGRSTIPARAADVGADVATRSTPLKSAKYFGEAAQRDFSPGIYQNPRLIAEQAAANVAPEHPALKELFGVTRDDLWEMSGRGTRQGNIEPSIASVKNPKGSYTSDAIMTPKNARRIVDTLGEAEKYPQLARGMDAWYVMDPAYQRMVQLLGPERAAAEYKKFNTVVPMFSPGSDVMTEINRGTAANMMIGQGEWPAFSVHGGTAEANRGAAFPDALRDVKGHAYHSTAQAGPVGRYLESGVVDMTQPKVPLYMQASGVPETGFQTKLPVPDAHFTRAVGMSDVRKNANPGASMKTPEYAALGPWYRENVAKPLGIEAVPAQARMWGTYAPQTGVDTAVGAPKLELLAQSIWERAKRLGIDPKILRDNVLTGKDHATWLLPAGGAGALAASRESDHMNQGGRALATARSIRRGYAEGGDVDSWQAGVDAANRAGTMRLSPVDTGPSDSLMGIGRAGDTLRKNAPLLADTGPGRIAQAIGRVATGRTPIPPPGMRREDYTDDPNAPQPIEPLVNDAMNVADVMSMGSLPAVAMRGAQRGALGIGVPPKEPFRIQPQDIRAPKAANVNTSKAEVLADLPPPLPPSDRIWQNYVKRMTPDEMLKSEPVWSAAENLSAAKGISPSEAFAEVANDMFGRMGANRFMTPAQAKMHMARERGVLVPVPAEGLTMKRPISGFAAGGSPDFKIHPSYIARAQSRSLGHTGPISSMVPGRTDHHAMSVPANSYVVPAHIPSALGQGNTEAGMKVLSAMFPKSGPYGSPAVTIHHGMGFLHPKRADGGAADGSDQAIPVPIMAAGGEFVIHPDDVAEIGGGDHKHGHEVLDHWVKAEKNKLIKDLRGLPPPAKD